jgi:integrase
VDLHQPHLAARADLKSVSEILGHSRPDTTTRIYQHTDRAMHEAAISRLPAMVVTISKG